MLSDVLFFGSVLERYTPWSKYMEKSPQNVGFAYRAYIKPIHGVPVPSTGNP